MANKKASVDTVRTGIEEITTQGDLLYRGATDLKHLPKGTSGQTLKMGSGNEPEWATVATPESPGWKLIDTAVASNSASLTITGLDSTYDTYAIGLSAIIPVTTSALMQMRFGDSSGIDSGSLDYDWNVVSAGGAVEVRNNSQDSKMDICHQDGIYNYTGDGYGAMLYIHNPSDSAVATIMSGTAISGGPTNRYTHLLSGQREHVIAHDRVQIFFSSGNISSGRMTIWGLAHS